MLREEQLYEVRGPWVAEKMGLKKMLLWFTYAPFIVKECKARSYYKELLVT